MKLKRHVMVAIRGHNSDQFLDRNDPRISGRIGKRLLGQILGLLLAGLFSLACTADSGGDKPAPGAEAPAEADVNVVEQDSGLNGVDGDCVAPMEWFSGPVPEPDPAGFPQESATNCDFHLISWQYFLWLTEEVDGKLRFETMYTDRAIYPATKEDRYHKLDIVEQALSKGILVDQSGRAVYSNIIINKTYRDWVLANQLYSQEGMLNLGVDSDFPVGSMSLKAAWKIVQPGEDVSKLYTTEADIELLTMVNGEPRIPAENAQMQKGVKVALTGLHIAVVVEGHPEFIWATFEFDDNAPDFAAEQGMNDPVSDRDWLFYAANTTALNTNANNAATLAFVDEQAQTLTPVTQVARQYVNGGGDDTNQGNIGHLNTNVKTQLGPNSIWSNYFEVGAIWFNVLNGLEPKWTPNVDNSMVTGSLLLSNSVIETFTQKVASQNNCFSCHNTMPLTSVPPGTPVLPGKNANTSHILLKAYQNGGQIMRGK